MDLIDKPNSTKEFLFLSDFDQTLSFQDSGHGVERTLEATSMPEPTEDEILLKAKQLAHYDARLWDKQDIEQAPWERERFADDSLRAEYLNRARKLLRHEKT